MNASKFPFESVAGLTLLFVDEETGCDITIWAYTHRTDGGGMLRMFVGNEEVDVRTFGCEQERTIKDWEEAAKEWFDSEFRDECECDECRG